MGSKMLIDAAHPEETRVVVVSGNRIEEFDYESADRKQLKGNIYLAKVTRVEPSLQAAFVDYGGNRHGFLAFSEIHPDYYQIPVADREALLKAEEEAEEEAVEDTEEAETEAKSEDTEDVEATEATGEDGDDDDTDGGNVETVEEDEENGDSYEEVSETAEDDIDEEEAPRRRGKRQRQRHYRIQEVIKRRQIILVQVVKEERGNKGAALTTYLSLAGRYCVLMPNTARGGGISRKISDPKDRKRLKDVIQALNVPSGAGLIVRTAGASRTKAEIKRDFDYLLRLWGTIRDLTLKSTAPSLVHEEGNLIKRSIRDLYNKEVDEVLVEGEGAFKDAKGFMKMLMPSHARHVKQYSETRPLFSRYRIEDQLDGLYSPKVTLPSGGYLIMNQTEALVSIDINSGKATREHSIEATALKTNIEAAIEISRQLRLRDLAGLIVIDFIDMDERRNNRAVERKLKEALKTDRARIQVGRISHFGLLEMSRQRLRQSMLEGTTQPCPHCEGTGLIRSLSSCALSVLRAIEDHLINRTPGNLNVKCQNDVACYILNEKRDHLLGVEQAFGISIFISPDNSVPFSECEISQVGARIATRDAVEADTGKSKRGAKATGDEEEQPSEGRKKRRRRRGKRSGRDAGETAAEETAITAEESASEPEAETAEEKPKPKRKRRSRKRGAAADADATTEETAAAEETAVSEEEVDAAKAEADAEEKPKRKRRSRRKKASAKDEAAAGDTDTGDGQPAKEEKAEPEAEPEKADKEPAKEPVAAEAETSEDEEKRTWKPPASTATETGPTRKGWWNS